MEKDLCLQWFNECFIENIGKERSHLLIYNGMKAHITMDMIKKAVEEDVILFCLLAHASHLIQPLDVSLNGPIKNGWKRLAFFVFILGQNIMTHCIMANNGQSSCMYLFGFQSLVNQAVSERNFQIASVRIRNLTLVTNNSNYFLASLNHDML